MLGTNHFGVHWHKQLLASCLKGLLRQQMLQAWITTWFQIDVPVFESSQILLDLEIKALHGVLHLILNKVHRSVRPV